MWIIVILILIGAAYYGYNLFRMQRQDRQTISHDEQNTVNSVAVKDKLIAYFDTIRNDMRNNHLSNFLRIQFDLDEKVCCNVHSKVKIISGIDELGLNALEIETGRNILKNMVFDISGSISDDLTEGNCLIFLINYYKIIGKQKALKEIKEYVTDKDRYEAYVKFEENEKHELINRMKKMANIC